MEKKLAKGVVGLDIGSAAVRAVELVQNGKSMPAIARSSEIALAPGTVSRGEILRPDVVKAALKQLWVQGGFKSKNVVLGTGNQGVIVRDLTVPKMSLKYIRESLPFHVQAVMQVSIADSILDFYPTSESIVDQVAVVHGLLVSAEKADILGNVRVVESAGLTPVEVDLIPFALNRLLVGRTKIQGTIALIDIGATTTSITIASQGVPWFVRIIPTGGDDLTHALQEGLEIEVAEAEELKRNLGLNEEVPGEIKESSGQIRCKCAKCVAENPMLHDPRSEEILQAISSELLGSLRSTINYFNNTRPQEPVEQVLLSGGGAQLTGIAQALSALVRIPVSLSDPFATLLPPGRRRIKNISAKPSMAVALGLALRSAT